MAFVEVQEYYLSYLQGRPVVWLMLKGVSGARPLGPGPGDAVFVTDMLRNEKPVYYDPDTNHLSTTAEEVGEEET